MDLKEISEILKGKKEEYNKLIDSAKIEERKLNDEENSREFELRASIEKLEKDFIEKSKNSDYVSLIKIKNNDKKMNKNNFSLRKAILDKAENRAWDEITEQVIKQGMDEYRDAGVSTKGNMTIPMSAFEYRADGDATAGTAGTGAELITEQKLGIIEALKANLVMVAAGATVMNNLKGDISIPVDNGVTADWATENGAAGNGFSGFTEMTFSPKRLTTYVAISKQLLTQDTYSVDAYLQKQITDAIAIKLEESMLDASSGATRPNGLFYNFTTTGATTWPNIVGMESTVSTNNALQGNLKYIVHPTTLGSLKTTAKATNTAAFIAEGSTINGYNYLVSSLLPEISGKKGVCFGNFADFVIMNWGGLDITVDPYTLAGNGQVKIIINSYWNFGAVRSASFAKLLM